MGIQGIVCTAACLIMLCARPAAADQVCPSIDLGFELPRRERPRRIVRDLLGRNRVRSLNLTRYEMALYDLELTPELASQPTALEDAEDALLSAFLRVSRERLERELLLEERYDGFRHRLRRRERAPGEPGSKHGLGLRISPRTYLKDGDALVGAKFRLKGRRSRPWPRSGLGVAHELSGDNLRLELTLEKADWATRLVFHTDRRRHGESAELQIGITF